MIMESLDDNSLIEVLLRCEFKELIKLTGVNTRLRQLIRTSPLIWSHRLKRDFGLCCSAAGEHAYGFYMFSKVLYRSDNAPAAIRFRGVFTSGGVDAGNLAYWVDNMFKRDESPYCSNASMNVDCLGVLVEESDVVQRNEAAVMEFLRQKCRYAVAVLEQVHGLEEEWTLERFLNVVQTYSDLQLQTFFLNLYEAYEREQPLGDLLFYGVPLDSMEQERRRLSLTREYLLSKMKQLEEGIQTVHVPDTEAAADGDPEGGKKAEDMWDVELLSVMHTGAPRLMSLVREIEVNRSGNLTCPVSTGVVFIGMIDFQKYQVGQLKQLQSDLKYRLQDESIGAFNSVDTVDKLSHCMSSNIKTMPVASRATLFSNGVVVHYDTAAKDVSPCANQYAIGTSSSSILTPLQPIAWFQFHPIDHTDIDESNPLTTHIRTLLEEKMPVMDGNDQDGNNTVTEDELRSSMRWCLRRPIAANVVVVKLINQENRMEELLDNHTWPNIDVASIRIDGTLIKLPSFVNMHE